MERLIKLTSHLITLIYLKPRVKIANAIHSILENEIKRDKNKMFLFLISLLLSVVILPLIIVYYQYSLFVKLKWSFCFLVFFIILILFSSAFYDARLRFNKKANYLLHRDTLISLEFMKDIDYADLAKNLLLKRAFKCDTLDLIKVLTNKAPSNQISITYVGANGRLSYHNIFFTFHYILKKGISDLNHSDKKELLTYISTHFKKGDKSINLKTLNQNYNDWLTYKFHKSFENEFLREFVNSKQTVKD
tara:strand:+ start:1996 stop:2739 length:744 start_codon:yes stop_codon:yes gene_type:complete